MSAHFHRFTLAIAICIFLPFISNSQELVGSAGEEGSNSNIQMNYSIGEVVVETNTSNTITQGYQQANITITAIEEHEAATHLDVYPNPTSAIVNIKSGDLNSITDLSLYDMSGQLVWSTESMNSELMSIDLTKFDNGVYNLVATEKEYRQTFQIIKAN